LQKIVCLITVCFLISGCASLRMSKHISAGILADTTEISISERVTKQNLTGQSFFIQRADIEYVTEGRKQRLLATIKFEYPDRYLISLKSRTGLEGARIFINKDSILVNDRINKTIYFGKALYLRRKFGIDQSFLPLLFGDLIENKVKNLSKDQCFNGISDILRYVHGLKMHYLIDCKKSKVTAADISDSNGNKNIGIDYDKFMQVGDFIIPKVVKMNYVIGNQQIDIKILKIEYPWNGVVKFIPGKGYEIIDLL
jgi:hypothetical protein